MEDFYGLFASFLLRIPEHVQSNTVVDVLLSTGAINRLPWPGVPSPEFTAFAEIRHGQSPGNDAKDSKNELYSP